MNQYDRLIIGHVYEDPIGTYRAASFILDIDRGSISYRRYSIRGKHAEVRTAYLPCDEALKRFGEDITNTDAHYAYIDDRILPKETAALRPQIKEQRTNIPRAANGGLKSSSSYRPNPDHPLYHWETKLSLIFKDLIERKDKRNPNQHIPVYALEHGLPTDEITQLTNDVVRSFQKDGLDFNTPRLPWIVAASEIGLTFDGLRYWEFFTQTTKGCGATTPQRNDLRDAFEWFSDKYRGAEPPGIKREGAWAYGKGIISWPVTHSILPLRFQVQLWEALCKAFDTHRQFSELNNDPVVVANLISDEHERLSPNPERFCDFARDNYLVGELAIAFMHNDPESPSEIINNISFSRIVRHLRDNIPDFDRNRSLQMAKAQDLRVAQKGVMRRRIRTNYDTIGSEIPENIDAIIEQQLAEATREQLAEHQRSLRTELEPHISLNLSNRGWIPLLHVPEMSELLHIAINETDAIKKSQVKLAGVATPLSMNDLLGSPQTRPLIHWPTESTPLIELTGNAHMTNTIVNDFLRYEAPWSKMLFRILRSGTEAHPVTNMLLKPGETYILVSSTQISDNNLPQATVLCDSCFAYSIDLSSQTEHQQLSEIVAIYGMIIQQKIEIGPAGLFYDESADNRFDCPLGEPIVMSLKTTLPMDSITIWEAEYPQTNLVVTEFVGDNHCLFTINPDSIGISTYVIEIHQNTETEKLSFQINSRDPKELSVVALPNLYPTELKTSPLHPSLENLWESDLVLELLGTDAITATADLNLYREDENIPHTFSLLEPVRLPMSPAEWETLWETLKTSSGIRQIYDRSDRGVLSFDVGEHGYHSLDLKRSTPNWRWYLTYSETEPALELVGPDETDNTLRVYYASFEDPTNFHAKPRSHYEEPQNQLEPGIYIATWEQTKLASVVIGRQVNATGKNFLDLKNALAIPDFQVTKPENVPQIRDHIKAIRYWDEAAWDTPISNNWRQEIINALRTGLNDVILGNQWVSLESSFHNANSQAKRWSTLAQLNIFLKKASAASPLPSSDPLSGNQADQPTSDYSMNPYEILNKFDQKVTGNRHWSGINTGNYLKLVSDPSELFSMSPHELEGQIREFNENRSRVWYARLFKLYVDHLHASRHGEETLPPPGRKWEW